MAHRAQQILDAFTATISGASSNVINARVYPLEGSLVDAVCVFRGLHIPTDAQASQLQRPTLDIIARIIVRNTEDGIDPAIAAIELAIYKAIAANYTLGLGFVSDTRWIETTRPEMLQGSKPTAATDMRFRALYSHTYTDPES